MTAPLERGKEDRRLPGAPDKRQRADVEVRPFGVWSIGQPAQAGWSRVDPLGECRHLGARIGAELGQHVAVSMPGATCTYPILTAQVQLDQLLPGSFLVGV